MAFGVGSLPLSVQVNGGTLKNEGPDTLYYRDESPVSASVNDGSLASGATVNLSGSVWVVSAGRSAVNVIPLATVTAAPYASVTTAAAVSLTSDTTHHSISWDTVREDTDGMFNLSDPTKLTVVVPGVYRFEARFRYASNATGVRGAILRKNANDSALLNFQDWNASSAASGVAFPVLTQVTDRFAEGDYVEVQAFQTSGGALNIEKVDPQSPEFRACFVRA